MNPGDQLESEAELATAHQVSRVTIRGALKILAGRGLLQIQRGRRADVGFHEALALADGNRVLIYLFEGMTTPLIEAFIVSRRGQKLRGQTLQRSYESHLRIFSFVAKRDAKAASSAVQTVLLITSNAGSR